MTRGQMGLLVTAAVFKRSDYFGLLFFFFVYFYIFHNFYNKRVFIEQNKKNKIAYSL